MSSLFQTRVLFAAIFSLLLGTTVARAQLGGLRDNGAFFSAAAKSEASRQIGEIGTRFKKDLVIETFKSIPDDVKAGVNLQDGAAVNRIFEQWAVGQARQQRVNGIYVLLTKEPSHLQVVVGNETQTTLFTLKDRDALVGSMLARLRTKQNDEALLEGVNFVAASMRGHAMTRTRAPVQAKAAVPTEDGGSWGWVLSALLGFGAAWLVIGIFRAIFGGRSGASAGTGVAPGSGGGFMTSLLGGMFGAAAGMWLYDQFSGQRGSDFERSSAEDTDRSRRDSDYSSSGDSFSDNPSGGDASGGDSAGGGDF